MAVDTRDKRASAIGSRRLPWLRRFTLPLADGALDQGDRQQVVQVYRGVLAGEEEVDPDTLYGWLEASVGGRLHAEVGGRLHANASEGD